MKRMLPLSLLCLSLFCSRADDAAQSQPVPAIQPDEAPVNTVTVTQWRGPNRDGIYPATGLLKRWPENGPELIWQFSGLGKGYASPLVTDDAVVTIGTHGKLNYIYAFTHDGELIYKTELGPEWVRNYPGSRGTPLIVDNHGYFLSGLGVVYCFDIEDGHTVWQRDIMKEFGGRRLNCGYSENLVFFEDKLFCTPAGPDSNVVALNRFSGETLWVSRGTGEESSYGNPVVIAHGGNHYFINRGKFSAYALDVHTGSLVWQYRLNPKKQANTPVFKDSCLLFIGDFGHDSALLSLSESGDEVTALWRTEELSADQGDVVIVDDRIYGADSEQWELTSLDWKTGKMLYETHRKYPMVMTMISAEGLIYCYDRDGLLYLYKGLEDKFEKRGVLDIPDTGKRRKRYHYSHPVIDRGRLYVRHQDNLFVYDIADENKTPIN